MSDSGNDDVFRSVAGDAADTGDFIVTPVALTIEQLAVRATKYFQQFELQKKKLDLPEEYITQKMKKQMEIEAKQELAAAGSPTYAGLALALGFSKSDWYTMKPYCEDVYAEVVGRILLRIEDHYERMLDHMTTCKGAIFALERRGRWKPPDADGKSDDVRELARIAQDAWRKRQARLPQPEVPQTGTE